MSAERIIVLVIGIIVLLLGIILVFFGGALLVVNNTLKDSEGFLNTKTIQIESDSYAVTTLPADIDLRAAWIWDWSDLAAFRVEGSSDNPSMQLFIGIAEEMYVKDYLHGVEHDEITDLKIFPYELEYTRHGGASIPQSPATKNFWNKSSHGAGAQIIEWELETGSWVLVLMNDDGSIGIDADVIFGAKVPILFTLGVGFLAGGIVILAIGGLLIYLAVRRPRSTTQQ